jgi:hypothetical protein
MDGRVTVSTRALWGTHIDLGLPHTPLFLEWHILCCFDLFYILYWKGCSIWAPFPQKRGEAKLIYNFKENSIFQNLARQNISFALYLLQVLFWADWLH